ncbi:TRAP transporter small permease subunit [Jannaschia sp. CCS1]|uniref:TRAP transporter small permease subunit n=1 Tax=Jannaschia sp. (strain CCS1) TaxID=290400 RepID=UPI000053DE08|nr:TRAP transporter small permease [Jannaschia sp. CCS1]ABD56435.1 TRAP dicarboxylate transporter DctQ subunit [Jannaschia sp. CCS1]
MAVGSLVLTDDSRISRLDQALHKLELVTIIIGGLTVFALMLLAVFSVGGRNFFNAPLPGYVDWIEQLMPVIAILGVAYVSREGGHIRMDILVGMLKGRALWAAEFVTTLAIFIFALLLLWGSWTHFDRSFEFGQPMWSRDSSMDIGLPIWPAKLVVPFALCILNLRLILQLWAYGTAFATNAERPVAVPLVADVATQAAMEARQVSGRDDV